MCHRAFDATGKDLAMVHQVGTGGYHCRSERHVAVWDPVADGWDGGPET
jgi:hypothetical protein